MVSPSKKQIEKFKEAAQELGCDEDEKRFDAELKRAASASSSPSKRKARNQKK
jgi:hypothetical protein